MLIRFLIPLISLLLVQTVESSAQSAEEFLRHLEGNFTGKGEAISLVSDNLEPVRCAVSNDYISEELKLNIQGRCATTQGKSNVRGSLQMKQGQLVGSFLSRNSKITQSSSIYKPGKLIVATSTVDNSSGNLSRLRQIIVRNGQGGFTITFQKFENSSGKYKDNGKVVFRPK